LTHASPLAEATTLLDYTRESSDVSIGGSVFAVHGTVAQHVTDEDQGRRGLSESGTSINQLDSLTALGERVMRPKFGCRLG
jgi:hypothetical protein